MHTSTNEYLREVQRFVCDVKHTPETWLKKLAEDPETALNGFSERARFVSVYSWAVPSEEALRVLAAAGPLIEIGAGNGYWAYLLRQRGVDIRAYDCHPPNKKPNHYHPEDRVWTRVFAGGPEKAATFPNRTLFLCWPPFMSPMAETALRRYTGQRVAYVGEWKGCTASPSFHDQLVDGWTQTSEVRLPNWPGIRDRLTVWERKRSRKNKNKSGH